MQDDPKLTSQEVLELVRRALAAGPGSSSARARLEHARHLQVRFRNEPIGGKLVAVKKLFHWFTASAFDRQAKAVEALLDLAEDLVHQAEMSQALRGYAGPAGSAFLTEPKVADEGCPRSLPGILDVSVEMLLPERLLLYSLVFGLKPRRALEIGTFRGGSASLICAAMDDNGFGKLVCVDPEPRLLLEAEQRIKARATVLAGPSPDVLPRAREAAGGAFDFALIDGDHSRDGVVRDVEGTLPHLADEAYLLFHDCHYFEVEEAIDAVVAARDGELADCGVLSAARNPVEGEGSTVAGRQVVWGGLRLLRFRRRT